jgi:aspartate/methionine/tyrosine aminotransferase
VEKGVWVLTDEIYEHLVYGDNRFVSMPGVVPELANQCVIVNGVAKTYAMTGWRVGWMVGPSDVMKAAINYQSHSTSNVANVSQVAALEALTGDQSSIAMMREAFTRRGATMHRMLNAIPGVSAIEPQGAFYCYPNVSALVGKPMGPSGTVSASSLELADTILGEAGVAFVPGEAFGTPGYARFSFAMSDADMEEGIRRIHEWVAATK